MFADLFHQFILKHGPPVRNKSGLYVFGDGATAQEDFTGQFYFREPEELPEQQRLHVRGEYHSSVLTNAEARLNNTIEGVKTFTGCIDFRTARNLKELIHVTKNVLAQIDRDLLTFSTFAAEQQAKQQQQQRLAEVEMYKQAYQEQRRAEFEALCQ